VGVVASTLDHLAEDLPRYRVNILAKIADVRVAGRGGSVQKLQETIEGIRSDLGKSDMLPETTSRAVVFAPEQLAGYSTFAWLGPVVGPLGTAGLVVAMVVFMLLERRDLRDRLIGLFGHGRLTVTTKAFEEAGTRVSRQLLMQSLVNPVYGIVAGLGLYMLAVPYALVWATLGATLRFIPYVGPVVGAGAPILISLAALEGWTGPLSVIGLFLVLELFTNLVLETMLYAGAAGVSQVALLASVAFWTWLWAPAIERGAGNYGTAAGTATRGKSTVKTHPVRARLRAEMRPLLASTPQRLNAKPKPMPVRSALRCANGRNSSSAWPSGKP